jgi:hypothetical protein
MVPQAMIEEWMSGTLLDGPIVAHNTGLDVREEILGHKAKLKCILCRIEVTTSYISL